MLVLCRPIKKKAKREAEYNEIPSRVSPQKKSLRQRN